MPMSFFVSTKTLANKKRNLKNVSGVNCYSYDFFDSIEINIKIIINIM